MYQMIYNSPETMVRPVGVSPAGTAAVRGQAGRRRALSPDRCSFRGQPGDDSGGFCRSRSEQRFDRILATRYMAESA